MKSCGLGRVYFHIYTPDNQASLPPQAAPPAAALKRKKSLPDAQALPVNLMSREEAAVLSSAQRHEVRRQAEEAAIYRANPLLYLTSPAVQVGSG